jgi:hypothetical protein
VTIETNRMAHVILTVSRFEVAREFYRKLLPEFRMKPVFDGEKLFYCVGARTAIGIEPCDPALAGERFVQQRVGLQTPMMERYPHPPSPRAWSPFSRIAGEEL